MVKGNTLMSMPGGITTTALDLAGRFRGLREAPGAASNAQVLGMLRLDVSTVAGDDVPWCSAFVNYVAWLLDLPRSRSLAARSWLAVGTPVGLAEALAGFDVVVLKRGLGPQPGPEVVSGAAGHVGFFVGFDGESPDRILLLGGNHGDAVNIAKFSAADILGIRRLYS